MSSAPLIDWRTEIKRFHKRLADKDETIVELHREKAALIRQLSQAKQDIKIAVLWLFLSLGAIFWGVAYMVGASLWGKFFTGFVLWGR